jgi:hypothetical protein
MVKNSYPELPEMSFKRTSVEMPIVVVYAKSLIGEFNIEYVRMAYAIFRNESANGSRGVNNNYGGIQGDVGRWKSMPCNAIGTCVKKDSGGIVRRFLCFSDEDGYKVSFRLFCIKAVERNMFDAKGYFEKWVGKTDYTATEYGNFESLLKSAKQAFPD